MFSRFNAISSQNIRFVTDELDMSKDVPVKLLGSYYM